MPLDDNQVRRTTDDALRHLDRMQNELRQLTNEVDRLGQAFRNDRRFSNDAYRLRDETKAVERELARARDRVRSIQRNTR